MLLSTLCGYQGFGQEAKDVHGNFMETVEAEHIYSAVGILNLAFLRAGCPSCRPNNITKTLTLWVGRRASGP